MTKSRKMCGVLFTAALFTVTTACGDDEPGTSDEVKEFCDEADALVAKYQEFREDETSQNGEELAEQAQDLAGQATELITANPGDASEIGECSERVLDAISDGG